MLTATVMTTENTTALLLRPTPQIRTLHYLTP